jgi:hypothetical protein
VPLYDTRFALSHEALAMKECANKKGIARKKN